VIIDPTSARSAIESTFDSAIRFTRDQEGFGDDTFDPITGTITASAGDTIAAWDGPCRVRPVTRIGQDAADEGGQAILRDRYTAASRSRRSSWPSATRAP
jgi:hypothetical protein